MYLPWDVTARECKRTTVFACHGSVAASAVVDFQVRFPWARPVRFGIGWTAQFMCDGLLVATAVCAACELARLLRYLEDTILCCNAVVAFDVKVHLPKSRLHD